MPGSHQSTLSNGGQSVSQLVSEWVSDKHSQWSDSGPIKSRSLLEISITAPIWVSICVQSGRTSLIESADLQKASFNNRALRLRLTKGIFNKAHGFPSFCLEIAVLGHYSCLTVKKNSHACCILSTEREFYTCGAKYYCSSAHVDRNRQNNCWD